APRHAHATHWPTVNARGQNAHKKDPVKPRIARLERLITAVRMHLHNSQYKPTPNGSLAVFGHHLWMERKCLVFILKSTFCSYSNFINGITDGSRYTVCHDRKRHRQTKEPMARIGNHWHHRS